MKRLVVALDDSHRAHRVLAAAVALGEKVGARLVLYRAIPIAQDQLRGAPSAADLSHEDALLTRARNELEQLAGSLRAGLVERIVADLGVAWDAIIRISYELDADLIVIGSHGHSGIERLFGGTATKVVEHADRNVLVVRTEL